MLTWISAYFGLRPLAILCTIAVFGAMAWTIVLIVRRRRAFYAIMADDGLSKREAAYEDLRSHGG